MPRRALASRSTCRPPRPGAEAGEGEGDVFDDIEGVKGSGQSGTLRGDDDAHLLFGGAADDHLQGRLGADTLDGGAGDDAFLLTAARGTPPAVSVIDFTQGDALAIDDQLVGLGDRSIDPRDLVQDVLRDLIAGGRVGYSPRDGEVKIDLDDDGTLDVIAMLENGTRLGLDDVLLS